MGSFAVVTVMKEIAIERRGVGPETTLARHLAERSFLIGRCNAGFLTPDQTAAIRNRIDSLESECEALRWLIGLPGTEADNASKSTISTHPAASVI